MGSSSRLTLLLTSPCLSLLLHPRPSHFRLSRFSFSSLSHRLIRSSPISIIPTHRLHTQISTTNISNSSTTLKEDNFGDSHSFSSNTRTSHPWPEWSHMTHALSTAGYFDQLHHRIGDGDDEYVAYETLSEEFVRVASACLAFARNRSDILGSLSRRDIAVIVENGSPFLFKSALDSSRRMRFFLSSGIPSGWEPGKGETVDLMKYLLSYASNPSALGSSSESNNLYNRENIETSVRNLLGELTEMMSNSRGRTEEHYQEVQTPRLPFVGPQNIQMKRGDWICPKCTFMNFARNNKCLECEESRPKRELVGGEWECPECDFFNYGKNMMCLRCDCKRPGEGSFSTINPRPAYNREYAAPSRKTEVDSSNQEKAERWFNVVSEQPNVSGVPNEDFPEVMPLRRGENRFVVSTRKTPLERRLEKSNETDFNQASRTVDSASINRSLDQILGPTSSRTETRLANNSKFTPFVPLPADMFAKKPQNSGGNSGSVVPSKSTDQTTGPVTSGERIVEDNNGSRKPDRWFKKVEELHGVNDSTVSSMQNEDNVPEMMPMRKGENRFVVSKQKDRSFTSPTYKRQMAVEQATDSKFVPFVPFPPDYFAKKDQKQQQNIPTESVKKSATNESSHLSNALQNTETQHANSLPSPRGITSNNNILGGGNENISSGSTSSGWSGNSLEGSVVKKTNLGNENENVRSSISSGWSGKSLEGSAVKETDPLDMSEEAKTERWFRRVAQIQDISELSQIPDEDFPSIMPMRKGVNRFVVSKRKTPLERRLTSPQYRRNLPTYERTDPPPNKEKIDGN